MRRDMAARSQEVVFDKGLKFEDRAFMVKLKFRPSTLIVDDEKIRDKLEIHFLKLKIGGRVELDQVLFPLEGSQMSAIVLFGGDTKLDVDKLNTQTNAEIPLSKNGDVMVVDTYRLPPVIQAVKPMVDSLNHDRHCPVEDSKCPICLDDFKQAKRLLVYIDKCKHKCCKECRDMAKEHKLPCPVCRISDESSKANQLQTGINVLRYRDVGLPGYEGCGAMAINYRLPSATKEITQEVKLVADPLYLSMIPFDKEDLLKTMLKTAVEDVILRVAGLDNDNSTAENIGKENRYVYGEITNGYESTPGEMRTYEKDLSSEKHVKPNVQRAVSSDKFVRSKTRLSTDAFSNQDRACKPDKNPTDDARQRHPLSHGRLKMPTSRMAFLEHTDKIPDTSKIYDTTYHDDKNTNHASSKNFLGGTDEVCQSSTSNKNDTTQQPSGHSDVNTSPKNMSSSSSSRSSAGPFTVNTIMYKYLEEKCTGDMDNLRSKYGVEIICKASNKQDKQGDVYIVCNDKQATNRALCTDEEMKEAAEMFISLYQNIFQRLFISNPISCNGIGDKTITEAKGVILNEIPLVMVEDSIDDEVTFVGEENEVSKAIKLFVKVTGPQIKSRKLKQNPGSNIAYHHDSSQNTSTDSSWKKMPQTNKDYEMNTPKGIQVVARKDDIVKQNADVIVNAANRTLNHGLGVAGALRDAAGYGLQDESNEISRRRGYIIKDTDCVSTKGYNHDHQSKPDNNPTENTNGEPPRFTSSYNRIRASSSSRMAVSFSEGTDEEGRSSTSSKNDTTQQLDGHSSEVHSSPKNMSSSSRPSAGPFTVNTILFKYLEDKCTGDMNNLRSRFGIDIICKAHNDQERQGDVYILCDDKQATNRARCTEEEMDQVGDEFISLYQYNFQRLTISNRISCKGIGDKMITEAKGIICAKTPLVMVDHSIDDEVTFVGEENEISKAIKLFVKVTGLQIKSRKLKQNPESNIAYHHDSSQNRSTDSSWKKMPQTSKDYEMNTPEGIHVTIRKDDIVKQNVDVIVNAANTTLNHGMGVAGALRDAAGYGLQDESNEISRSRGYTIKDTDCVYTIGYNLPCQFVVHAVGPMYSSIVTTRQKDDFFEKLERTFLNSFALANTLQARSVAIPLISSGLFGAPKQTCAKALVDAIYEFSRNEKSNTIDTMILVNRDDDATDAIQKAMRSRLQNDARSGNRIYGQLDDGGGRSGQTTDGVNFQGASASNWNYSSVGRNTGTYSLTDDDEYGKHFPEFEKNDQHSKRNHQNGTQGHGDIRTAAARGKVENGLDDSEEEDKKCPICLEDFAESKKPLKHLDKCKHTFCEDCWDSVMKHKPVCPICGVVYGTIRGNQPDGRMDVRNSYSRYPSLPGYEGCGTITINYSFPSGTQKANHPEPGQYYSGTNRTAYLPDNAEGNKVLALLRRAFDARLTFTIGTSVTTGVKNMVTWNDIHHKTRMHGGPQAFGYPDATYLKRVTEELAAKGIK